ncbi:RNA helicase [uncultured Thiomicrorhabdus sp.]
MDAKSVANWMQSEILAHECLYQDDVVDYVVRAKAEDLLRENADGNLVLGRKILNEFKFLNEKEVVWVRPEKYWRLRVPEDEEGRDARG